MTVNVVSRWRELAANSHYAIAVAVRDELMAGDIEEATEGIEELIAALSRSDQRELRSQMVRLMMHIIKWKSQPSRRSRSWLTTIDNARLEIDELLESEPHLRPMAPLFIEKYFAHAKHLAEREVGQKSKVSALSWSEIFEEEYDL